MTTPTSPFLFSSPVMRELWSRALAAAPTNSTILITGETGVGKGVLAAAIHAHSARASNRFEKCNIAALSPTLIESELFGHRRGAFTGAIEHKPGRFETAHTGTLFLDEIGEMPLGLQPKLLTVLDDGVVHRVGDSKSFQVDVRLIAATNTDLQAAIAVKLFREDLYYRLNVVRLHIPPLRERREDVEVLAKHFLNEDRGKDEVGRMKDEEGTGDTKNNPLPAQRPSSSFIIHPSSLALLQRHSWPGNVRELKNAIEQAVLRAGDARELLPEHFSLEKDSTFNVQRSTFNVQQCEQSKIVPLTAFVDHARKQHIARALDHCNGNREAAARLLGVRPGTIRKYE